MIRSRRTELNSRKSLYFRWLSAQNYSRASTFRSSKNLSRIIFDACGIRGDSCSVVERIIARYDIIRAIRDGAYPLSTNTVFRTISSSRWRVFPRIGLLRRTHAHINTHERARQSEIAAQHLLTLLAFPRPPRPSVRDRQGRR